MLNPYTLSQTVSHHNETPLDYKHSYLTKHEKKKRRKKSSFSKAKSYTQSCHLYTQHPQLQLNREPLYLVIQPHHLPTQRCRFLISTMKGSTCPKKMKHQNLNVGVGNNETSYKPLVTSI
jgi:hypothetical protein